MTLRISSPLLALSVALSAAVSAQDASSDTPIVRGIVAFRLDDRELTPEGITYDPAERSFLVGSLYKRKIVRISVDGKQSDFVPAAADGLGSVLGMMVDPLRRELWANSCNPADRRPPMIPDDPDNRGRGGVYRYDLRTGKLIAKYLVGWQMAPRCFNDLVMTPDGTVYLSSGPDGIYRVRRDATAAELFTEHHSFVNGIAASDDGRRLFLADDRGIYLLDLATRQSRPLAMPTTEKLAGIDGLYVRGRTLVAIQNGRRNRPERVVQVRLSDALDAALCIAVLEQAHPEYDIPTTGVLVGPDFFYIAASQLERFNEDKTIFANQKLRNGAILKTPLLPDR